MSRRNFKEWISNVEGIGRTIAVVRALEALVELAPSAYATFLSETGFPSQVLSSLEDYGKVETLEKLLRKTDGMTDRDFDKWMSSFPEVGPFTLSEIKEFIKQARAAQCCGTSLSETRVPEGERNR